MMMGAFWVLHSVWKSLTLGLYSETDTIRLDLLSKSVACHVHMSMGVSVASSMLVP